jgi:DNA polymerase-3 subunit gamma/tau
VKFVFATTEGDKMLATIVSRCQRFDLRRIQTHQIVSRLSYICGKENIKASDDALLAIARGAEGGMRDAQSMLDQLLTFSEGNLTAAAVQSMYGLLDEAEVQNLTGAVEKSDYASILKSIDRIVETGCDAYRVLRDLERCFRQKFLDAVKAPEKSTYVPLVYAKILEILQSGEEQLQRGLSVRSNLEAILFRAVECTKLASIETLLQAFNNLPKDVKKNAC